jgi:hypothetical protein
MRSIPLWLGAFALILCGAAVAGDNHYGPAGRYDGPGPFPGCYGGYLYGYLPGPKLPARSAEVIVCKRLHVADRYRVKGNALVYVPVTNRHCRVVRSRSEYALRARGAVYKR